MEHNSFDSKSFEDPEKDSDKPDKKNKKKSGIVAPIGEFAEAPAKTKAERDLVKSLDRLPLFEKPKEITEHTQKAEAAAETSAAPEVITDEENAHLQQEVARDHLEGIEHVEGEAAEELEPAVEFLQRVSEGESTDEAFAAVAAEIGLDEAEISEALAEDPDAIESIDDAEAYEDIEPAAGEQDGDFDTSDDAEGEIDWRSPPPTPPHPPRRTVVVPGAAPVPPVVPMTPSVAATGPRALPERANDYYQNRNKAGELLLIGLVGYLIGRRRGRLRTERKLLPTQRKLEKQVKQLESDITHKEQQLVAAKAARKPEARAVAMPLPVERTQPGRQETRLNMQKPVRAEHLGHMIVAAEAPVRTTVKTVEKTRFEKPNSIRDSFRPEAVKDMHRAELLELSEKITVEGASLRHIYESSLIGEKQLRHLVSEYLRGKDIRKDLRKEMVEHEIDFERDPILRDRVRSMLSSNDGAGTGLGEMLEKAGITKDQTDPTIAHRAKAEQRRATEEMLKRRHRRLAVDTAMVTAIVVLSVMVAILVMGQ